MTLSPETSSLERITPYRRRLLRKGFIETAQVAASLHTDLSNLAKFDMDVGLRFPLTYRLEGSFGAGGKTIHAILGEGHDIYLNSDGLHVHGPHVPLKIRMERYVVEGDSTDVVCLWDQPKDRDLGRTKRSLGMVAYTTTPTEYIHGEARQVELITGEENGYVNDPESQLELIRADIKTLEGFVRY
jgi:hypothetical protein